MICFIYPGQPMTMSDVPSDDADFQDIAARCSSRTGFDPQSGIAENCGMTDNIRLQLHGVAVGLWRERQLFKQGILPQIVAEHSMGIYPALVACGAISSDDALEMTCRVGMRMATMGNAGDYSLGCVTGLTEAPLAAIAANHGVYLANYNTSRHFLLAGLRDGIEGAVVEAEAAGAFSASCFPCDAPLHTPLMEEIAADLRGIFADYSFREPQVPLMEHIGQGMLKTADMARFLSDELCRPVYWERCWRALRGAGVTKCHEIGAGSALSKFNRWIDSES